ncbi:hypothetical protein N7497_009065 [Penicillium chrysogenum]|uniref:Uncharacterized protein n=1 Tax=Penicillium chrysogenum TaxID=5076 RepID=A0ABQ8WJQ5_PENCH|nr:hypothetical protein N7505_005933 [Penicillium chrysogenum]KAJ6147083.1 hypothetical protein N7497_009065 [Penicillium chrysogenum]
MVDPQQDRPQPEAKRQGRPPHESTSWHPHNARQWKTSAGGRTVKKSASLGSKHETGISACFAALRCEYPRVNEPALDLDSLLQMKGELLDYVRSLYVKGANGRHKIMSKLMFTDFCARVNERDKAICNDLVKHDDQG